MSRIRRAALRERAADQLDALTSGNTPETPLAVEREAFESVVATEGGEPVGFGTVHPEDGQIHAVFVDPERAESGVGRRLLDELEARARDAGTDALFVLSTPNAAGFYERCGYRRAGEETIGADEIPVVRMAKP